MDIHRDDWCIFKKMKFLTSFPFCEMILIFYCLSYATRLFRKYVFFSFLFSLGCFLVCWKQLFFHVYYFYISNMTPTMNVDSKGMHVVTFGIDNCCKSYIQCYLHTCWNKRIYTINVVGISIQDSRCGYLCFTHHN